MVYNDFKCEYDPTIEDYYEKVISIDARYINLKIIDTAGAEEWNWDRHYNKPQQNLFLLVYSIDRMVSFEYIKELYNRIARVKEDHTYYVVLVGNKNDLPDSLREVSYDIGNDLANEWNAQFFETSAKTGHNVERAFRMVIRQSDRFKRDPEIETVKNSKCNCL